MITPKEIAEKIAKGIFHLDDENVKSLAHDYLELKNHVDWLCKNTVGKTDHDNILKSTSDLFKEEITKLKEEIEKLKKSRDVLRKSIEWYEHESNWLYPEIRKDGSRMTKTIFVMREKAREAIKEDDEIMGGVK